MTVLKTIFDKTLTSEGLEKFFKESREIWERGEYVILEMEILDNTWKHLFPLEKVKNVFLTEKGFSKETYGAIEERQTTKYLVLDQYIRGIKGRSFHAIAFKNPATVRELSIARMAMETSSDHPAWNNYFVLTELWGVCLEEILTEPNGISVLELKDREDQFWGNWRELI